MDYDDDTLLGWSDLSRAVQLPMTKPTAVRLEKAGRFPKSVRIGKHRRWRLGTIRQWRAQLMREAGADAA